MGLNEIMLVKCLVGCLAQSKRSLSGRNYEKWAGVGSFALRLLVLQGQGDSPAALRKKGTRQIPVQRRTADAACIPD